MSLCHEWTRVLYLIGPVENISMRNKSFLSVLTARLRKLGKMRGILTVADRGENWYDQEE